jgi:serine/threonine protein phosphatase PrpC
VKIRWEVAGASDVGRVRKGNEDSFFINADRGIFLVADGMGGHAAGEIASALAAETAGEVFTGAAGGQGERDLADVLREGFSAAQEQIVRASIQQPRTRGMGTTLTACLLTPDGLLSLGHVGDSRLYRFRDGRLEQLSSDHTWVQREVDAGRLSAVAARTHPLSHILTRVLSTDTHEEPDLLSETVLSGDLLLLATDGLTGMLDDTEIARILSQDLPIRQLLDDLIRGANAGGGTDNITGVLVRVLHAEQE